MTIHKSLIAFAVSALLATAAQAAEPVLPKDLPPYAPDKPLPVPQIEKKTLANGLEVWVVPRSGIPRVDYVLAKLQTLWGDAKVANQVPGWIEGVTSEDLKRVAATYLTPANRTVIDRKPAAMIAPAAAKK